MRDLGPGQCGPVDKSSGFGGQAGMRPIDKSEGLGARLAQDPVNKSEALGGRVGPGPANCSVVDLASGTSTANKIDMSI